MTEKERIAKEKEWMRALFSEPIIIRTPKKTIIDSRKEEKKEMTKKYRLKVNELAELLDEQGLGLVPSWKVEKPVYPSVFKLRGQDFIDLKLSYLEEVKEKDPVEKVAEWMETKVHEFFKDSMPYDSREFHWTKCFKFLAKEILKLDGIDPERLG